MLQSASQEIKLQWKELILKQSESGLSIERWCRENNIRPNKFYYWKKKLFPPLDEGLNRAAFTELDDKNEIGIFFECNGVRLHIEQTFDPIVLKKCLKILQEI